MTIELQPRKSDKAIAMQTRARKRAISFFESLVKKCRHEGARSKTQIKKIIGSQTRGKYSVLKKLCKYNIEEFNKSIHYSKAELRNMLITEIMMRVRGIN